MADFSDYKTSDNKGFRYIFVITGNFSKYLWTIPLKNENGQTIRNDFSNILRTSIRRPFKLERDRGADWYSSVFRTF